MYDPTVCDIVVRTAKGFLQIYLVRMTEMEPWYPARLGLAEQYRYVVHIEFSSVLRIWICMDPEILPVS